MRGVVASVDFVQPLIDGIRNNGQVPAVHLDWEDFLQRPEIRAQPVQELIRPLFDGDTSSADNLIWENFESDHPALAVSLGGIRKADSISQAFAVLRQASAYQSLLDGMQSALELDKPDHYHAPRKCRSEEQLFAVGDVLIHRFFGPCVVVGWDETCQADNAWVRDNKIHDILKHGTEQPFYNVLLESDDTARYCSQENMELCQVFNALTIEKLRAHPQSRFFFRGPYVASTTTYTKHPHASGFMPSEALEYAYPDDVVHAKGERDFRTIEDLRMTVEDALKLNDDPFGE